MMPVVDRLLSLPETHARPHRSWGTEGRIDLLDMYTIWSTRIVQPVEWSGRGGSERGIAPIMGSVRQSVAMRGAMVVGRGTVRSINITTTLRAVPNTARPGTSFTHLCHASPPSSLPLSNQCARNARLYISPRLTRGWTCVGAGQSVGAGSLYSQSKPLLPLRGRVVSTAVLGRVELPVEGGAEEAAAGAGVELHPTRQRRRC
jgi:hypothetical protein